MLTSRILVVKNHFKLSVSLMKNLIGHALDGQCPKSNRDYSKYYEVKIELCHRKQLW